MADLRLMPEMPDYRTEPSPTPEGDAIAVSRWGAWARDNLDPLIGPEASERYGVDQLLEEDRDRMVARVIKESELIGFWLAWHRAGGFEALERGGWDRSTIFRKIRRFRTYYGIHPDNARFPWMALDWEQVWRNDRLVALNWAHHRTHPIQTAHPEEDPEADRWQPHWAPVHSDPHDLVARDVFAEMDEGEGRPGPIEAALAARRAKAKE